VAVVAPRSPSDCFNTALEAARIALTYRTPVVLLSDGYLANGSEPWLLPEVASLPDLRVEFATAPNTEAGFLPYLRDPETLARPWAVPGTPGLEHRIGGLEKADRTGDISYDPANHDLMVRTRAARIEAIAVPDVAVDDPDGGAQVLVLGWGSTYGPIGAACRALRTRGHSVAHAHLRHLSPLPANLDAVLRRYEKVVIPEVNLGQLAQLIRGRFLVDAIPYNQVRGLPFTAAELEGMLEDVVKNA
jgi:2-oxoglutarate ferredoxin oxidoreductase subunit alpha